MQELDQMHQTSMLDITRAPVNTITQDPPRRTGLCRYAQYLFIISGCRPPQLHPQRTGMPPKGMAHTTQMHQRSIRGLCFIQPQPQTTSRPQTPEHKLPGQQPASEREHLAPCGHRPTQKVAGVERRTPLSTSRRAGSSCAALFSACIFYFPIQHLFAILVVESAHRDSGRVMMRPRIGGGAKPPLWQQLVFRRRLMHQ